MSSPTLLKNIAIFTIAVGCAAAAFAQAQSGNVYGRVTDESGGVLPGVNVTLSGVGAPMPATSGSRGDFRFLSLSAGSYKITTELPGFATVERLNVNVNLGANTEVTIVMKIAPVATTVTVTSETPLLDTRKQTSGSTLNSSELKMIPTARDPWVILQQVPGVQVDRINVGGSQSGQQSQYVGKGVDPSQNAWNVDGVTITDMSSTGGSPTYYDFDAFEEMQATTGGSDPSIAVPGVTLNMVTKRGTSEVHGSARVYDTPHQSEAYNIPQEAMDQGITSTNRVDNIQDYGVEAGGPVWPDKAWLWGSYGRNQINLLQTGGTFDRTTLEDFGGKLNVQPIDSNSFTLFFFRGDKIKQGRGSGPMRPQETSWDQSGPTTIWKGEDSQVFGPSLALDVSWNYVDEGFRLTPEGGVNVDATQDANAVWHNSYYSYDSYRPQHQVNAKASYFLNTGSAGHELKFGFGYRNVLVNSRTAWPGSGNVDLGSYGLALLTRPGSTSIRLYFYSGYLADTISLANLTVNLGVRYDYQYGNNNPSVSPANRTFPDLLPALNFPGQDKPFKWENWEPRAGLTYALGAEKKTLLRASYARFADQLGSAYLAHTNPTGTSYLYYYFTDANGNGIVDPGELGDFYSAASVDPANPADPVSPNRTDPNLKSATTDEYMIGIDHEIMPNFVAGLTYTYRHRKDLSYITAFDENGKPLTAADWTKISDGKTGYDSSGNLIGTTGPIYDLIGGYGGSFGSYGTNNPGYAVNYNGLELQLTKRLSGRWMAHGSFTYADWKQKFDSKSDCRNGGDPTDGLSGSGGTCDNGAVWSSAGQGSGPFQNVYINSKWTFNANGLYQLPMNFDVSANFFGRQGYILPYYYRVGTSTGSKNVLIGPGDGHRNANVYELDLRLQKVVPLFQKADLTLSFDLFNALNSATILQRNLRAGDVINGVPQPNAQAGQITEVQSPRILRFGATLSF